MIRNGLEFIYKEFHYSLEYIILVSKGFLCKYFNYCVVIHFKAKY